MRTMSSVHNESTQPAVATRVSSVASVSSASMLYGGFAALREISLEVMAGEFLLILGENGAGKSTLLRLIAGLATPTQGSVTVLGGDPRVIRSRLAYMSHAPMLYDEMTAAENLSYFASLYCSNSCACATSPEMALRAVGLDPELKRPIGEYSQGMRQRVSLARALQSDPELLLLDEPFSNLDVSGAQHMVDLLRDFRGWPLLSGARRTVLLTTHQAELARPLADRVITLHAGRIASIDHTGASQ